MIAVALWGGDARAAGPDAHPYSIANVAAPSAPPPSSRGDFGTRWVYAAAIGGLVVGGLIARFRKKKDAK